MHISSYDTHVHIFNCFSRKWLKKGIWTQALCVYSGCTLKYALISFTDVMGKETTTTSYCHRIMPQIVLKKRRPLPNAFCREDAALYFLGENLGLLGPRVNDLKIKRPKFIIWANIMTTKRKKLWLEKIFQSVVALFSFTAWYQRC